MSLFERLPKVSAIAIVFAVALVVVAALLAISSPSGSVTQQRADDGIDVAHLVRASAGLFEPCTSNDPHAATCGMDLQFYTDAFGHALMGERYELPQMFIDAMSTRARSQLEVVETDIEQRMWRAVSSNLTRCGAGDDAESPTVRSIASCVNAAGVDAIAER